MTNDELAAMLAAHFDDAQIHIEGDGCHVECIMISTRFEGKNTLARQREVYAVLTQALQDGTLHAFSMKLYTPEEWLNEKQ